MAHIKAFRALRPQRELAVRICELPYDVMSSDEARRLAADNPLSFLHVSKPEIDLPPEIDHYDHRVYAKGKENFQKLIAQGALRQGSRPQLYFYRQVMGRHSQTGLVAVASCDDYRKEVIKKHELTRLDKEEDRVRHIEALNAQTGPAFLAFRSNATLDALFEQWANEPPDVEFTAADNVRHSAWPVNNAAQLEMLEAEFARLPALYIADGHHRTAAAVRVYEGCRGAGESGFFLSVIFPHHQTQILPYHRVLKELNGQTPAKLLEALDRIFRIETPGGPEPAQKHEIGLYLQGQWHTLRFRPEFLETNDAIEQLDVALLQKRVLAPLFGIVDPRTSERIQFVGGIRGTAELERLVQSGDFACAFAMFPTSIEELMAIADAGGIMPPKSTWFEPKLRDGMFCHII